jgi:hypothetical protein
MLRLRSGGGRMRYAIVLLVATSLGSSMTGAAHAQAVTRFETNMIPPWQPRKDAPVIPDSVRRKVGYQHWKGGAIGGSVGALAALLLGVLAPTGCADCTSTDSDKLEVTLIGAGLGGAFGFLVGAASPKYRWEAETRDTTRPRSE